ARMCFERHATSKIKNQKDLFAIRTLGFRGEALASIAAVAQVKMRTRLHEAELGTETQIEASTFQTQEAVVCPPGTMFEVKNLFFNVPARRNFLKSNPVETRHILNEFVRVALAHPEVHLSLTHNDTSVYQLPTGAQEERIIQLFGTDLRGKLKSVEESTGYVRIGGYIGNPEVNRKNRSEQFFFVNGRYIRSNYLNHAVYTAFEPFLPRDTYPFYVIFLEIDPVHVDINIHPTKTEVKFDDEQTIYALLHSVVKRGLGTVENAPEFDFTDADLKAAIYGSQPSRSPEVGQTVGRKSDKIDLPRQKTQASPKEWDALYKAPPRTTEIPRETASQNADLFGEKRSPKVEQLKEDSLLVQHQLRYILTQKGPDLMIIDQHLAHQRILYER
ncbi:MAG: DNA mismatch repair endonuclease MutL, partial [Bacteroidota bacterium]